MKAFIVTDVSNYTIFDTYTEALKVAKSDTGPNGLCPSEALAVCEILDITESKRHIKTRKEREMYLKDQSQI